MCRAKLEGGRFNQISESENNGLIAWFVESKVKEAVWEYGENKSPGLDGLLVWENEVPVNLLQYADNTIFIGEASLQNVITIKSLRTCFELVSGIQVNFNKSGFGTIGVDKVVTERYANLLNCRVMHVPFVYLGIPIGANPRIADTWSPVIFKLAKKLGAGGEAQIIVFLQGGCV
ncbi:hypothetical protein HKD37_04G009209 [Glycine soja]|nr:hypothetical protein GmHk_04G009298 [Glycine max]